VQRAYDLAERPGASELQRLGEPWRPYRSIATLYLWRSLK
jgi:DNA-3-methyladenine glycosylase II